MDYFAVGVMAYECMYGRRPYVGKSRKRSEIISYQNKFKLKKVKFKEDGQLRQLISSIK